MAFGSNVDTMERVLPAQGGLSALRAREDVRRIRLCIIDFEDARQNCGVHYGSIGTSRYRAPEVSLGKRQT